MEQFDPGWDGNLSPKALVSNSTRFWPAKFVWAKLWFGFLDGAFVSLLYCHALPWGLLWLIDPPCIVYWIRFGTWAVGGGVVLWLPSNLTRIMVYSSLLHGGWNVIRLWCANGVWASVFYTIIVLYGVVILFVGIILICCFLLVVFIHLLYGCLGYFLIHKLASIAVLLFRALATSVKLLTP